jgi:DHA1 family inner membrane transport protein
LSGAPPTTALRSAWPNIVLIVGAGVVSAFQVGKAPIALPSVQEELGLGLGAATWLISAFALIGAVAGAPVGLAVDRVGAKRMAVFGLLLMGLGSALGALAPGAGSVLATRVIEGLGFLALVVAAPALIANAASPDIRDRAMALWATFMPFGMTIVMLAAPLLTLLTWRGFWLLNALMLVVYASLIWRRLESPAPILGQHRNIRRDIGDALAAPGPWILGGLFAAFSAAFFAVFGLLPSFLSTRLGIGGDMASMLSALAVAASAAGNLVCGQLLARGGRPGGLLIASFGAMALSSIGIFNDFIPGGAAYALCVLFSLASGLVPVVIFDSAPRSAPRPDLVGITIGFAMQGNNVGLVLGPAVAGSLVASIGWTMISATVVAISLLAAPLIFAHAHMKTTGVPAS